MSSGIPSTQLYHLLFETLGYLVGFSIYRRLKRRDFLDEPMRWTLVVAAILGAVVGSKVLHHLANPAYWPHYRSHPELLLVGKTIVGGLLGGWIAVEVVKKRLGVLERTGDLYVLPLLVGIACGRVGCFLSGLEDRTYGVETALPWGIDFGDGVARHPTQLYEILFLCVLGLIIHRPGCEPPRGARFRAFVLAYMGFRLAVDFIKPYEAIAGLNAIQWAALAALLLCWRDVPALVRTFLLSGSGSTPIASATEK